MPYVGNSPASNFASVTKDTFSGDGSTTAFTLSKTATTNGVAVFVENVRQEPTTAYSVSGTTLTFTAAPVSASGNNIYVLHHNTPASTATHPAAQDLTAANSTITGTSTLTGAVTANAGITMGGTTPTLTIGDAGAEDTKIVFDGNAQDYHIGLDDSADSLIIGKGSALGTTSHIVTDENGHVTMPLQPAFLVSPSTEQNNLTHDQTMTFDTEIYDQNADFSSNTFTAPVTGRYLMCVAVEVDSVDTSAGFVRVEMATSNRAYSNSLVDPGGLDTNDYMSFDYSIIVDMDANDTCFLRWGQSGGSNVADLSSRSFWSGALIC